MYQSTRPFIFFLSFLMLMGSSLFGEGRQEVTETEAHSDMAVIRETRNTVVFREAGGREVEITKNPKRTVITHNSIMDTWYMSGGTSLTRVRGSVNVPFEAEDLPIIGSIANLNTEKILELEPDLLIVSGTSSYQQEIRDFFEAEGVPGLAIDYNTYDDFIIILDLFTRILGTEEILEKELKPMQRQVDSIIEQAPKEQTPSVCILFASTRSVRVETERTVTGNYVKNLGGRNIYEGEHIKDATRVDLSLEYIYEQDPDIIFVVTMGDIDQVQERFDKDVATSDIWGDLSAVKNNRFHYLDISFSLYRPNRFYPQAFKTIAEYLYADAHFEPAN